jgi:DNA topoisomerase IB
MKREGRPREKVLATIVSLLEKTLIRVGNAEYVSQNKSYGLRTMRRKHVDIKGGTLRFEFTANPASNGTCESRTNASWRSPNAVRTYGAMNSSNISTTRARSGFL